MVYFGWAPPAAAASWAGADGVQLRLITARSRRLAIQRIALIPCLLAPYIKVKLHKSPEAMPLTELLPFPADQKCSFGNVGIIGAATLRPQAGIRNFKTRRAGALRGADRNP